MQGQREVRRELNIFSIRMTAERLWELMRKTLPGPDYFDEEAKCYSRLFESFQVTFCRSRQWGRLTLAKI